MTFAHSLFLLYFLSCLTDCAPVDDSTADSSNSTMVAPSLAPPPRLVAKQFECTNSKYWGCIVSRVSPFYYEEFGTPDSLLIDDATSNVTSAEKSGQSGKIFETHVFYLNKVEPISGQLFVSATLRWRFKASTPPQSAYRFLVSVRESSAPSLELGRFQIDLSAKIAVAIAAKAQPVILIRFDNSDKRDTNGSKVLLNFGETYTFKVTEIKRSENGNAVGPPLMVPIHKIVSFSSLLNSSDVAGCEAQTLRGTGNSSLLEATAVAFQRRRRELASRWSTSIREITFYPLHLLLNVSFYGAPPSHCIQRYAVELWFHDVVVHDRKFVDASELIAVPTVNSSSALVGSVTFAGLERDTKYTIRVVPQEHNSNGECICEFGGKCGCVTIRSNLFTLNNLYNFYDDEELPTPEQPTIRIPTDNEQGMPLYWLVVALFLALTFVFLALVLLLFVAPKEHEKRNYLFVQSQQQYQRDARKPLMRDVAGCGDNTSGGSSETASQLNVLILNAETRHSAEAALLARIIRDLSAGRINVMYDRLDAERVDENVQQWAGHAVNTASKIILFHGRRAAAIVGRTSNGVSGGFDFAPLERDIFDDVFYAAHAALIYTDPRILHAKWEARSQSLFRAAECMFVVPRDLCHMLTAIGLSTVSAQLAKRHEESFKELRKQTAHGLPLALLELTDITNSALRISPSSASMASAAPDTRSTSASDNTADAPNSAGRQQQQERMEEQIRQQQEYQKIFMQTKINEIETKGSGEDLEEERTEFDSGERETDEFAALQAQPQMVRATSEEPDEEHDSGIYSGESAELCTSGDKTALSAPFGTLCASLERYAGVQ